MPLKEVHTLDLAGVAQADSACLSLLLSALRLSRAPSPCATFPPRCWHWPSFTKSTHRLPDMNKRAAAIVALALAASTSAWAESNPADPYEGYNRFMFKVNDTADR